jgi:hypothetical protein
LFRGISRRDKKRWLGGSINFEGVSSKVIFNPQRRKTI